MTNPWSLVVHVGHEIIVNRKDIFHHVQGAISNWKSHSYENFGKDLGAIVADLCGVSQMPNEDIIPYTPQVEDLNTVKSILEGVVIGFLKKEIPEVLECVRDANS